MLRAASRFLLLNSNKQRIHRLTSKSIATTNTVCLGKARWVQPYLEYLKMLNDRLRREGKLPLNRRTSYYEWNLDAELYAFGKRLNASFDTTLLKAALIDKSHIEYIKREQSTLGIEESSHDVESNKEMASKGQQIIRATCESFITKAWPHVPLEGVSAILTHLCSVQVLSEVALSIGIKDLVFSEPYPPSADVLATTIEAVTYALAESSGVHSAEAFVTDFVAVRLVGKTLWDLWRPDNPLATAKQLWEQNTGSTIAPRIVFQTGVDTLEATYQVAFYDDANKSFLGSGYGETVSNAIHEAATDMLLRLFGATPAHFPLPFVPAWPPEHSKLPFLPIDIEPIEPKPICEWTLDDADHRSKNIIFC